ncbi:maleylpyruvate isomerase family mycothiol-dependent enzyme [Embleya scabrispora]|uniref:maleylpyruvate isomerase family mycothiol-dependent enzyme n=1 Tax=Embleya scabrispora TaxID=159449 RepID=UPI00037EB346|nr:maleylpyruvate isomerase family mycothiol-dependent enzyme [Embleya scabrispora]MYS85526.1 maleylpyruvate isomerase family mycothiol-dependent enzyme [Streptomyces sp. SID5474]
MDRDQTLAWVRAERLSLADLFDDLDEKEWAAASLCGEWTVREVAAHLTTSTRTTLWGMIKGAIRARGDFDRMVADEARELAVRFTPAELVAQLRETAGSARRAPMAARLDPLADALVHGQDVARPLGRVRRMPVEPALAALGHVLNSPFYGARKRFRGTRLVADDAQWSAGKGPDEVRGPVADLLLLATGRPAGLGTLSGSGLERIKATL